MSGEGKAGREQVVDGGKSLAGVSAWRHAPCPSTRMIMSTVREGMLPGAGFTSWVGQCIVFQTNSSNYCTIKISLARYAIGSADLVQWC